MTVYVDVVFCLNTVINFLLLRGSAAMGGRYVSVRRLLAAAGLGGVYAVLTLLPGQRALQGLFWQLVSCGLMLVLAFGFGPGTVRQGLYFLCLSFAFSGLVLLVVQAAEPDCLLLEGRTYYAVTTPALLLLAAAGYGVSAAVLTGCGRHTGGELVDLTLSANHREVTLKALRDTGNTLCDPITGQPVLVVSPSVLQRLFPQILRPETALQDPQRLLQQYPDMGFRLIPYRAVGTERGLLPALRCSVRRGRKTGTLLAAFSPTEVSPEGRFDALWGGMEP